MAEVLERDTVGETIEATVNYILDNGEKIFTQTAVPGATDVRSGGTPDPRRVTIRNARVQREPFVFDRDGFRFVRHDTKVADFFDEGEIRRVYYPEMEALVFKVYDSSKDGRARWSAHTAFEDPTSPPNARPRESIEIRTLAFF